MSDTLLAKLEKLIDAAGKNNPQGVAITGVSPDAFAELQAQVAALMAQNAELMALVPFKSPASRRA